VSGQKLQQKIHFLSPDFSSGPLLAGLGFRMALEEEEEEEEEEEVVAEEEEEEFFFRLVFGEVSSSSFLEFFRFAFTPVGLSGG